MGWVVYATPRPEFSPDYRKCLCQMFVTRYGTFCFTARKLSYQKRKKYLAEANGLAEHLFHGNNMEVMMV